MTPTKPKATNGKHILIGGVSIPIVLICGALVYANDKAVDIRSGLDRTLTNEKAIKVQEEKTNATNTKVQALETKAEVASAERKALMEKIDGHYANISRQYSLLERLIIDSNRRSASP